MTNLAVKTILWRVTALHWSLITLLLLPFVTLLAFHCVASQMSELQRKSSWLGIRRWIHVYFLIEIAGLWAYWSFQGMANRLPLWCTLVAIIWTVHWVCYRWDRPLL